MSNITVIFWQSEQVFRVLELGLRELTLVAAEEAFGLGCTATVHVDGLRLVAVAGSVAQLYDLVEEASST